MTDVLLLAVIAYLSRPVVTNLLSQNQVMNTSFDPFKLVNTYGAFGSVGEGRYEPVVALSEDGTTWREVDLPCKPTDVRRRPCFSASPCGNQMSALLHGSVVAKHLCTQARPTTTAWIGTSGSSASSRIAKCSRGASAGSTRSSRSF